MRMLCAACFILHCSLFISCSKDGDTVTKIVPARHWVEKTVAVVAPLSDATSKEQLERTAAWFTENLTEAQRQDTLAISLKIEWYDEDTEDLTALSKTLAGRDDITAIIGPFGNDAVETFATACQEHRKPLIVPTATSEEILRRYAVKKVKDNKTEEPFLWALTESDATFAETIMSSYATFSEYWKTILDATEKTCYFFSPTGTYGQTFEYWAPFFAENYNIDLLANTQYQSNDELASTMAEILRSRGFNQFNGKAIFCVVESLQQLNELIALLRQRLIEADDLNPDAFDVNDGYYQTALIAANTFFVVPNINQQELIGDDGKIVLRGLNGFSPYADPTTGFEESYQQRFDWQPTFAESKFYDGLLLAAFAACYREHYPAVGSINDAITAITKGNGNHLDAAVWDDIEMTNYLKSMENGQLPAFRGASGDIAFDPASYAPASHTTYLQWQIHWDYADGGNFFRLGYFDDSGSQRLVNNTEAWKYLYDQNQAEADFASQSGQSANITYPALTDQYAVLVQGSHETDNVRHMGDVMMMYQLLRKGGFDDDHIILIVDKATAADKNYVIRADDNGPDLMGGTDGLPAAVIDYDNAGLSAADISSILLGVESSRIPTVLPRDAGQNVLLFWSGHGGTNAFKWRNDDLNNGFTSAQLKQTAWLMRSSDDPTCRKLLVVAEPCYGESVISALDGIDGALGISGANRYEQSWGDNWSVKGGWLCDRFSLNFYNCLSDNPRTNYHDLFLYLAKHTIASHARIVNANHFGNLSSANPGEFIIYGK